MQRLSAYHTYLIMSAVLAFARALMFSTYAYGLYYIQSVGMTPLQLVLVGTVLELSVLVLEVPTGIIADVFSRRLSVIVGVGALGASWCMQGLLPFVGAIMLAQVVSAFGYTCLSGALEAWLADEVGAERVGAVYVRSGQIERAVELVGIAASVGLAGVALNLPFLLGGALTVALGLFLGLAMPEHGFVPTPRGERTTWQTLVGTFRAGAQAVRRRQTLTMLWLVGLVAGGASEGFDRLWGAHLLTFARPALGALTPVAWFALVAALSTVLSFGATALLQRRLVALTGSAAATARALLALNALAVISVVVFALAGSFALALAAVLLKAVVGALAAPLYSAWLVQHIDAKTRATTLSIISQTDALGQSLGGPAVGAVGNRSLRAALLLAGVLLAPTLALYARALRGDRAQA